MRHLLLLLFLCPSLCWAQASRDFDGTNDEVDMGNNLDVTTGNVSVCAWTKLDEDATQDFILGKKTGSTTTSGAGYTINQQTVDLLSCIVSDGTEGISSNSAIDVDAAWFFSCGTWTASTEVTVFYIQGDQADTDTGGGAIDSLTSTNNLQFGEDNANALDADGRICYGRIHTAALTAWEVMEAMWHVEAPLLTAPGGLWPLWGASTEQDLSGNGLTGTVSGTGGTSQDGPPVMVGGYLPI